MEDDRRKTEADCVIEEQDFIPTIADGERIRFDIRHVSGVRRLERLNRIRHLIRHPVTTVILVWITLAVLLAFEVWK